jgi:hypothetical protein
MQGQPVVRETLKAVEVRTMTGQSLETIRAFVKRGIYPNVSGTRRLLIPKSAVHKFLEGEK